MPTDDDRTRIHVLGTFAVRTALGEVAPTAFGGRLARRFLRVLVAHRGQDVARDVLTEALWHDRRPADPDANLNVLASRARRALQDRALITTTDGGYRLAGPERCWVDAEAFSAAVHAARERLSDGHPVGALQRAGDALGLWGEPFPDDRYEDWAQPIRRELASLHEESLVIAAAAALAGDDVATAVEHARRGLLLRPTNEHAAQLLMRALAAAGDRPAALAVHDELRRRLAGDLGLDPSAATEELHRQLLRDEVASRDPAELAAPPSPRRPAGVLVLPFVGRDRELGTLLRAVDAPGGAAVVAGASGSGKSRLLDQVERSRRLPVVRVAAPVGDRGVPFALAATLVREVIARDIDLVGVVPRRARHALADVVPELAPPGQRQALDATSRRALQAEGALRVLEAAATGGLVVLVDDLQWADATSLEVLARAAQRAPDLRLVVALRPEEVEAAEGSGGLLAAVRGSRIVQEVQLGPLAPDALAEVVVDGDLAEALRVGTDMTPMALTEAMAALADREVAEPHGALWRLAAGADLAEVREVVSAGQQRAVLTRVSRQPAARRDLLTMLALLGAPCSAALLAAAEERPEADVLADLDRLLAAGLVRLGDRGWHPTHDQVAAVVEAAAAPGHLVRTHARLAAVLESRAADPARIARHRAGAGDVAGALAAYLEAARRRLAEGASREAAALADAAIALAPPTPTRVELLAVRGEARARTDDIPGAQEDLRAAIGDAAPGSRRARLMVRLANIRSGAADLVEAGELADMALREARAEDVDRARVLATAAVIHKNLGDDELADRLAEEAVALSRRLGDSEGVVDVLDGRAMAIFLDGDLTAAVAQFGQVAALYEDQGRLLRAVTPRSTRGHALVFRGRPEDGLAEIEAASDLARSLGHDEGVAFTQWHRGEALVAAGDLDGARAAAQAARRVAHRLGHRGWEGAALLAAGLAEAAAGDLPAARQAYRGAMELARHHPLLRSWAASRCGLVALRLGHVDEARALHRQASADAPGLAAYEAAVLEAAIAAHVGAAGAATIVAAARERCVAGGHVAAGRAIDTWGRM